MVKSKINISLLLFLSIVLVIPVICFSESIKDGVLMRENACITLKNGSVVECKSFWWLVSTADFVQCDKGDNCIEFPIEDVDIGKTFGQKIAEEYAESEDELKREYAKKRKDRGDERIQVKSSVPTAVKPPDAGDSQDKAIPHSTSVRTSKGLSKSTKSDGKAKVTSSSAEDEKSKCKKKLKLYRYKMRTYCRKAEELKRSIGLPPSIPKGGKTVVSQKTADEFKNYVLKQVKLDDLTANCNYYKKMVKEYEGKCK